MDKEESLQAAMQLIYYAGNAKSSALQVLDEIDEIGAAAALDKLDEAKNELKNAHEIQTKLIQSEIRGDDITKTMMLIHAQDHFTMATIVIELLEKMINRELKNA